MQKMQRHPRVAYNRWLVSMQPTTQVLHKPEKCAGESRKWLVWMNGSTVVQPVQWSLELQGLENPPWSQNGCLGNKRSNRICRFAGIHVSHGIEKSVLQSASCIVLESMKSTTRTISSKPFLCAQALPLMLTRGDDDCWRTSPMHTRFANVSLSRLVAPRRIG